MRRTHPGARTILALGVLLTLVGLVVAVQLRSPPRGAVAAQPRPAAAAAQEPEAAAPARAAVPARRLASLVTPEAPLAARLPSGRVVGIEPVTTRTDGTLAVPEDITTSGWWRGGAKVGDPFGSILVAAHIDSRTQGLGPYADLLTVRRGEVVRVTTRHLTQDFAVRSRRLLPQGSLADERWLFSPRGRPRLTLVTCAPPYDASRGGYQNLAVVTAVPVTDPTRRSR